MVKQDSYLNMIIQNQHRGEYYQSCFQQRVLFKKCSHYAESFVFFCEGFCYFLLFLFNVLFLLLFGLFTYPSLPPEVIGYKKWLFLVIVTPSFKLSPPSFNSSCINELFWNFSQKHLYFVLDKHLPP